MAGRDHPRGDGSPFDLPGRPGGDDVALLLHGLTGSPFELRPVAERIAQAGVRCVAPLLPGHESPEALARTSWLDWLAGAREALLGLGEARRTLIVGSSMGALAACALAAENPGRVDGLALLAPALELMPLGRVAGWLSRHTPVARLLPNIHKRGGSDVGDREMRAASAFRPFCRGVAACLRVESDEAGTLFRSGKDWGFCPYLRCETRETGDCTPRK